MAHKALHDIVHQTIGKADNVDSALLSRLKEQFEVYLAELKNAERIASLLA